MKKIFWIFICSIFISMLVGCQGIEYIFIHDDTTVEEIVLFYSEENIYLSDVDESHFVKKIDKEDIAEFLQTMKEIEFKHLIFGDPYFEACGYIVYISYEDGCYEYISPFVQEFENCQSDQRMNNMICSVEEWEQFISNFL